VTRVETEKELLELLRDYALGNGDTDVSIAEPLGQGGVGCDSLALVRFVTAVENRFSVELPDSIWQDRHQISIRHIAGIICSAAPGKSSSKAVPCDALVAPGPAHRSMREQIKAEFQKNGIGATLAYLISKAERRLQRAIYQRQTIIVMSRDLKDFALPEGRGPKDLVLREASDGDIPRLNEFWSSRIRIEKLRLFNKRRSRGCIPFIAVRGTEIVGIDWISPHGDEIPELRATIRTHNGSCYGFDLSEKYRGEGIGLALLEFSLAEAKRRGFQKQVTYTSSDNAPMLSATIHRLGFQIIAIVESFRFISSIRWRIRESHLQNHVSFAEPDAEF
jgi:GNAT superfamily N-acetyltransferase/acyl carrier protein